MSTRIFISYRRDDSAYAARGVHDRLAREFGSEALFMDVDGIAFGVDFVEVLAAEVAKCAVLLAIIGPDWLEARDEAGERRLDSAQDFVRIEIATALKREIPVVPILLEGTRMPKAESLPVELAGLVRRNGLDVSHASFHDDLDRLVRALRKTLAAPAPTEVDPPRPAGTRGAPVVAAARKLWALGRTRGRVLIGVGLVAAAAVAVFVIADRKSEFTDCATGCPTMVVVEAGRFVMGSPETEPRRYRFEGPRHEVTIAAPFAVSQYEVTFDEWDACVAANACPKVADKWGRGRMPVINVGWNDARHYVRWLSRVTGKPYRLPSEAEWEYAARGGTTTRYSWGDEPGRGNANCARCGSRWDGKGTAPVGSFGPNPFGLHDMHGNVGEWVEDVFHDTYDGAPTDGSAWIGGGDADNRTHRDGSWLETPNFLRAASRGRAGADDRQDVLGFRVARSLTR